MGLRLKHIAEIDNLNDIDGLASLIDVCDVIVTVSNTTAHLSAALGKHVILMLPFSRGLLWYWHIDRTESPWYPSTKAVRQSAIGDWTCVIKKVHDELVRHRNSVSSFV
jgi:ADP-heptose:LPS heptosyltransferase